MPTKRTWSCSMPFFERLNCIPTSTTIRQLRKSDVRKLEEPVREIFSEFGDTFSKLKIIDSNLATFFNKLPDFKKRISALESCCAPSIPASYTYAVQSIPVSEPSSANHFEKLEIILTDYELRNGLLNLT